MASQPTRGADGEWSRFSNLLQPIRDLAANWNIDLAGERASLAAQASRMPSAMSHGDLTTFPGLRVRATRTVRPVPLEPGNVADKFLCASAADLEGYLEELGGLAFDFGNGKKLNCAEAALVIQARCPQLCRRSCE